SLRELLKQRVKALIVLGEAREKIRRAYEGVVPVVQAGGLSDAVSRAKKAAARGDCVLFSPMCASFDMFGNYEQRGMAFKEIVCESRE
ncbi:MAG: UDP-N-acetylmuramoyl-L-alanine--D-glutamate ligase, partial [Candidatus Omnitrophota bacterium]